MPTKPDTKLTFAEITSKPQGERYVLFKDLVVKTFKAVATAKEHVVERLHDAMKLTAALKRDYVRMLTDQVISPDTTEKKFFADYAGGDLPARVKQLATFFNAVTLTGETPLIPETFIDAASINSLEKAAPIIAEEMKNTPENWQKTPTTLAVVEALSTPGDATKKLKKIREQQRGETDTADPAGPETESFVLVTMLKRRIEEAKDDDAGFKLFVLCQELAETWPKNTQVPANRYAEWLKQYDATKDAPKSPTETPAPAPAPAVTETVTTPTPESTPTPETASAPTVTETVTTPTPESTPTPETASAPTKTPANRGRKLKAVSLEDLTAPATA